MKRAVKAPVVRLVLLLLGVLSLVSCANLQRRLIYFPPVLDSATVGRDATAHALEPWTNSAGQTIGWKRLCGAHAVGRVLVLHGNAGCAFQCARYADVIQQVAALDVFMVEYPGYADRSGKPTERTLYDAAKEALALLPKDLPIYLVGESLGTGVACYLASYHPDQISGIALLGPYTCLADVGKAHFPFLPVRLLICDRFPSEDFLRKYHGPVAMLVGGRDEVVTPQLGRLLYESYAGPKRLWEFPGYGHGAVITQPPEVWKQVLAFLGIPVG